MATEEYIPTPEETALYNLTCIGTTAYQECQGYKAMRMEAMTTAIAVALLSDPTGWARELGIPLGKPVDETAYLQARLGTVREMISHMTPADFLTRLSLEESQVEMEAELAELGHQMAQE